MEFKLVLDDMVFMLLRLYSFMINDPEFLEAGYDIWYGHNHIELFVDEMQPNKLFVSIHAVRPLSLELFLEEDSKYGIVCCRQIKYTLGNKEVTPDMIPPHIITRAVEDLRDDEQGYWMPDS